jgi:hypothetical protein
MYKSIVYSAPPRSLLYVPNGLTLERYHALIDSEIVVDEEPPNIRAFMAPLYISSTFLKDYTLPQSTVSSIDTVLTERRVFLGPRDTTRGV